MKVLVGLCILAVVALTSAKQSDLNQQGCIFGECVPDCEVGTHLYSSGCGLKIPEPTCNEPNPVPEYLVCDYSTCYCDAPTVRDTASGKCVAPETCPKKA